MPTRLTRRAAAAGLFALMATGMPASAAPPRLRSVAIDVRPLAAKGVRNFAARVSAIALPIARAEFAADLVPDDRRAPRLVIEISEIRMAAYGGGGGRSFGDAGGGRDEALDWITGAGVLIGPDGRILARHPVTASRSASEGGAWFLVEESERRRLDNLCQSLAGWIRRAF